MIRGFHRTDWFTLGNACAGMGAQCALMRFLRGGDLIQLKCACALLPLAP